MKEEDLWDKKLFRETIKARKREKKRKMKEFRRLKAGIAPKESNEDSEDSGPDLSWLPDPDKIYGKESTTISEK